MLCQFCLGRKQNSDQLQRMVLNSTSEHWNASQVPASAPGGEKTACSRGRHGRVLQAFIEELTLPSAWTSQRVPRPFSFFGT